jgi:hypothetical protein
MHRESTGVRQLFREDGKIAITSRDSKTNDVYLALFNINDEREVNIGVNLKDLGLNGECKIVEMWNGTKLGKVSDNFTQALRPHASILVKITGGNGRQ